MSGLADIAERANNQAITNHTYAIYTQRIYLEIQFTYWYGSVHYLF